MPTHEQFKLGDVQRTQFGLAGPEGLYYGVAITNQHGAPLLSISYRTEPEAKAAHHALLAALGTAVAVTTPGLS